MSPSMTSAAKRLELIPKTAAKARERNGHVPARGSQLATELAAVDPFRRRCIDYGANMARLRLVAAEDHLVTIGVGIAHETIIYGTYSVARACCEIAARAWWLLDPDVSADDRALRCLTDRFYSLGQQLSAAPPARKPATRQAIATLQTDATNAGVDLQGVGDSFRTAQPRPRGTDLMGDIFGADDQGDDAPLGEIVYRVLSAYVHGTDYALREMLHRTGPTDDEGMVPSIIGTELTTEAVVVMMALTPYVTAAVSEYRLHGWQDKAHWSLLTTLRRNLEQLLG